MLKDNIKELRTEQGLTQTALAEKIGVSQGAVFFWEKGINEPTAGYLIKLAEIFNVSVDELLSFEGAKEKTGKTKFSEMSKLFSELSPCQQEVIIHVAREFLKK